MAERDEEIGREIIRVLGESRSPLKANDIRVKVKVKIDCSRQDINRVLYKKKHVEVELANEGQTPPLWQLKVSQPAPYTSAQTFAGSSPIEGVASPGQYPGGPSLTGGVPASPMRGVAFPGQLLGGMTSSTSPPSVGNEASPTASQMYTRKDFSDGSLTFKPVGGAAVTTSPQVMPGHMTNAPSHMTGSGRDMMPGHVTCFPVEETHDDMPVDEPPQEYENNKNSSLWYSKPMNEILDDPATTSNQPGGFSSNSQETFPTANKKLDSKSTDDPCNFSVVPKNFPSKEDSAKNFKVASQVERVMNNTEIPSSISNSPSTTTKPKKKKPIKLAATFPQHDPASQIATPSHASIGPPVPDAVSIASVPSVTSSMQALAVEEHSVLRTKILEILRERKRMSTEEMSRRLGLEGSAEELIYSLMKLVEEGGAVKRREAGVSYWTAKQ